MELKHSKYKNTGVLFEILIKTVTTDILNNKDSAAINIIKTYFNPNTELGKELNLYRALTEQHYENNESKANKLIDICLQSHTKINKNKLDKQKYNLIKEIKESYNLDTFCKTKIINYPIYASIYKLFEYTSTNKNPVEVLNNREAILENIIQKQKESPLLEQMSEFAQQDKEIRLYAFQLLTKKFNKKYSTLNKEQKELLRQYINSGDTPDLKTYILEEINIIKDTLTKLAPKIDDKVIKIKINESITLLNTIKQSKNIKEEHISSLLQYYELIKELKKI
jgi:hypothetical protein